MGDPLRVERDTVEAMIRLHCLRKHAARGGLCERCSELLDYADMRLGACPFGSAKPTCAKCTVHCYSPSMRDAIRGVMRYAGPRMLFVHPVMALRHLVRGMRRSTDGSG